MKKSIGVELVGKFIFIEDQSEIFFSINPAAVDVDRVARELDFQVLQDNIEQITLCNIDAEVVS